jgi:hypothetical protein
MHWRGAGASCRAGLIAVIKPLLRRSQLMLVYTVVKFPTSAASGYNRRGDDFFHSKLTGEWNASSTAVEAAGLISNV